MRVAEGAGGELVACDSVQLYRGFDIGSAKPNRADRDRVPHHLIDAVDWHEPFDAQRFVDLADEAVADIQSRGRIPIVCGGTGLYLRAFRYGLVALPAAPPGLRETLHAAEAATPGSLYARLLREDPESAKTIEPNNTVYIVRALEIMAATGERASDIRRSHGFRAERRPMTLVALRWTNEALRERIRARIDDMLSGGLLDETQGLLDAGVDPDARPMRAVGYREAVEVIRGEATREGLEARIEKSTWGYARRQRTWLRKEPGVIWHDVKSTAELAKIAEDLVRQFVR